MTCPSPAIPAGPLACGDLTARLFRALYREFDLYTVGGTHIAVPAGTPRFAGPSLGTIARQISARQHPAGPALGPAA